MAGMAVLGQPGCVEGPSICRIPCSQDTQSWELGNVELLCFMMSCELRGRLRPLSVSPRSEPIMCLPTLQGTVDVRHLMKQEAGSRPVTPP